jgi:hypothetical protein
LAPILSPPLKVKAEDTETLSEHTTHVCTAARKIAVFEGIASCSCSMDPLRVPTVEGAWAPH